MTNGFRLPPRAAIRLIALSLVAAVYFAVPNARPDLTLFNADDSESYVGLSYALTHGLGYTRSLAAGFFVAHTTWPPGMALLLAPATASAPLVNWLAVKLTIILIGLAGVVLAWIYVRRVAKSPAAADLAALLLALDPFHWLFSRMALSEAPTTAFILLALLLIDIAWTSRGSTGWRIALAGLAAGLGMLLRGTVAGLILVPLAYAGRGPGTGTRRVLRLWGVHAAAFCAAPLAWAIRNHLIDTTGLGFDGINQTRMLLAADPVDPVSPLRTGAQIVQGFADNLIHRIIYHVPEQMLPGLGALHWRDWPGAPALGVALTAAIGLAALPRAAASRPLAIALLPYCLMMAVLVNGGSARYWVPITSLTVVLIVIGLAPAITALRPRLRTSLLAAAAVIWSINLFVVARDFVHRPYLDDLGDMVAAFDAAGALSPPPAATLTEHNVLFTLETGLKAPFESAALPARPRYTHMITRTATSATARALPVPPGATELVARGAWRVYALPGWMTLAQVQAR